MDTVFFGIPLIAWLMGLGGAAFALIIVSMLWVGSRRVDEERGENIRHLAEELNFSYRFRDPAVRTADLRGIPLLSGWRYNQKFGGVMHGAIDGREAWLFDFRCFALAGNTGTRSNENIYTIAVIRQPDGSNPAFTLDTDGMISPYAVSHKLFHSPLAQRLKGRWALESDGRWLAVYKTTRHGDGCFATQSVESCRAFFTEALQIARELTATLAR